MHAAAFLVKWCLYVKPSPSATSAFLQAFNAFIKNKAYPRFIAAIAAPPLLLSVREFWTSPTRRKTAVALRFIVVRIV